MHSDQMCGKTKNIEGLDDVFDVFCLTKRPILALNFWSVIVLFSERVETWRYQGGNDQIDWRNGDCVCRWWNIKCLETGAASHYSTVGEFAINYLWQPDRGDIVDSQSGTVGETQGRLD